jgi:hypothetical protein
MKLWIGLAVALLCGCAGAQARHQRPADAPMNETQTFGPSRTIYWR